MMVAGPGSFQSETAPFLRSGVDHHCRLVVVSFEAAADHEEGGDPGGQCPCDGHRDDCSRSP
jgi:hypothetical protein